MRHLGHFSLKLSALRRVLPVVTLEEDIERLEAPGEALVLVQVNDNRIHETQRRHEVATLLERDDGGAPLHTDEGLIRGHADDEAIAALTRGAQDVEVSLMEHVKTPGHVAGDGGAMLSRFVHVISVPFIRRSTRRLPTK